MTKREQKDLERLTAVMLADTAGRAHINYDEVVSDGVSDAKDE
jgi:hypothetical protein